MIACVACAVVMAPKKNGATFIEMADADPYKLWSADLMECPNCGALVLYTAPTQQPIAHHHEVDFDAKVKRYGAHYRIQNPAGR